jgi:hypothetical protein
MRLRKERRAKMAEQWEMCEVGSEMIEIFTPKGYEYLSVKEFVKRFNVDVGKVNYHNKTISFLLTNGWEPFATGYSSSQLLFRRKYQG